MSAGPFNTGDPIAYFMTWTTYGTWLLGDDRGSWHNGELRSANELEREAGRTKMKETAFLLTIEDREIVEETIARHCEVRSWTLHAANARSNHVHVVVTAVGYNPETVRDQFKAWCTRRLKLSNLNRERFWTEGASCRWINRNDDLEAVVVYVKDAQDVLYKPQQARRASK